MTSSTDQLDDCVRRTAEYTVDMKAGEYRVGCQRMLVEGRQEFDTGCDGIDGGRARNHRRVEFLCHQ